MRVAVFSDIHANYHAFRACFADAKRHQAECFLFLGDYVSDLAEPEKTMDLVYEIQAHYPTICLRGNREGYMLDQEKGEVCFTRGSKSGSLLFTYEHLREQDVVFFKSLKICDTITLAGVSMEIAHASMEDDRYYFDTENGAMEAIFPQMQCKYLLTGHSHKQYIRSASGKIILNPGSVGVPQDGSSGAKYAILDIEKGQVSCLLREVPYDIGPVIHTQFASGLTDYARFWAIGVLYDIITGEDWVMKLLKKVQEAGDVQKEEVWQAAASQLGMKFAEQEILEFYQDNCKGTK